MTIPTDVQTTPGTLGNVGTPSLSLLPGPLWFGVVTVRVPTMGQIDLNIHYSWNHLIVCREMSTGACKNCYPKSVFTSHIFNIYMWIGFGIQ